MRPVDLPRGLSPCDAIGAAILRMQVQRGTRPLVVGLCGAQGSGKSTLAGELEIWLASRAIPTATLSIDDLYRTKAERAALAIEVHPLLQTRGVPGTHDVALGLSVLDALDGGSACRLPRFDKAIDDRLTSAQWPIAAAGTRVLLFEGWCVGARPQPEDALDEPINTLERVDDGDGRWRRFVNAALGGEYQQLFGRIDMLVLLAAPGFQIVREWRIEQEQALRAKSQSGAPGVMSDAAIERFIEHYERITRAILLEMPKRADMIVWLASDRHAKSIITRI